MLVNNLVFAWDFTQLLFKSTYLGSCYLLYLFQFFADDILKFFECLLWLLSLTESAFIDDISDGCDVLLRFYNTIIG